MTFFCNKIFKETTKIGEAGRCTVIDNKFLRERLQIEKKNERNVLRAL